MLKTGIRAGLSPSEIWRLTWFEFHCLAQAVQDMTVHDFNVMRHGASLNLLAHVDKKHRKSIAPDKLFPLPNDRKTEHKRLEPDIAHHLVRMAQRKLIDVKEVN